jgi:DNA-binding SARP family transcriptional activator
MTQLYVLGPAEMRNSRGELDHSFLAGPKRLALFVYLLLHKPHGFHRRDSLLPIFWPEQDQKSARNSLSNMLYHIRKTLGTEVVENRGSEEISINPDLFWCDAVAFEKAMREKDYETALTCIEVIFSRDFTCRKLLQNLITGWNRKKKIS